MKFYKKLKPFQAITFDLDDTLYDNNVHMPVAEAAFLADLKQAYPATMAIEKSHWLAFRQAALGSNPNLKNDMGELRKQVLDLVFQSVGFSNSELHSAVEYSFHRFYFHRSNFTVEENIHSLLKALAIRYPLVAITNGNVNLQQIGLEPYFCHVFKANLEQPMKPHRAMFDACKEALNLAPEQILHVGDNLHNDVYGAIKAGFQSAWYAHDRAMCLKKESLFLLPDLQLNSLHELLTLATVNER
ncbi:HAD-IA family hydrolase [Flavobacterium sp. W21_SRS_FM6]|uniref:HAD-IA family hydrolase n=1 Tax=Flavobacterium sp. W21_SRS_FM6 TaxID=3240268 RepID=UPI003F8F5F2B